MSCPSRYGAPSPKDRANSTPLLTSPPAYLSTRQVASELGLHPKTVTRLILRGDLRAFRPGGGTRGHWRIPRQAVQAFIRKRERQLQRQITMTGWPHTVEGR